ARHRLASERDRHVTPVPQVVSEVVLDHLTLVAEAEDELPMPEMGVVLHDVPEDRLRTHRHHRLRAKLRLLAEAGSLATAKDHDLHTQECSTEAASSGHPAATENTRRPPVTPAPHTMGSGTYF